MEVRIYSYWRKANDVTLGLRDQQDRLDLWEGLLGGDETSWDNLAKITRELIKRFCRGVNLSECSREKIVGFESELCGVAAV
jgi:hypothetical protein